MPADHPAEAQREPVYGKVIARYQDTWSIDVELFHQRAGARLFNVRVQGHYLPELHTTERQSKVLIVWMDAYQLAPVAIPIHNDMIPGPDKPNYIYWSEHGAPQQDGSRKAYRTTIDVSGNYEVRNLATGARVRIEEDGSFIRVETPNLHATFDDAGNLIELGGQNIHLGQDATEKVVLGSTFLTWLQSLITVFDTHNHPDAGTNNNPAPPLPTILSEVSKTL